MARMQHTLSRNDKVNKFVIHNFNSNQNITIDVPTIWDESRFLWGDVIINPGAELTISCKITMPPAGRIIVKRGARLIIDGQQWLNPPYPTLGGWVTSSGPTHYNCGEGPVFDRWTGIEVWGNPSITSTPEMLDEDYDLQTDDPGVVIIKNAGIVERAERGIFGQMRGNSWPTQQQHFGGLISVNNGEFRDCRKAIEYYSSSPLSIPSTFINCRIAQIYLGSTVANDLYTFEGVTSWQVSGLSFDDNCLFENLDNGIVLGNADATIQKSEFLLCYAGIRAFMTNNLFNKSIKIGGTPEDGNLFKYCKYGVWSLATGRVRVEYNEFEDCTDGIIMENTSWHVIHGNSFTNKGGDPTATLNTGVAGLNNGELQNYITCNTFSKQGNNPLVRVGVYLGGSNKGTIFDGNFFICQEDVKVIDHNGNIGSLPNQSWQLISYNFNLFTPFSTSGHVSEITTPNPNLNKTELFKYYPPTLNCNSNFIPRWPILGTCEDINVWSYQFENVGHEITPDDCSSPPPPTALRQFNCSSLDMCLDSFNIRLNGLNQHLLPGASPELISLIQNAPTSTGTITSLISASPYLSEDILSLVANSNMNEEDKLAISALNMPISPFIRSALEGSISEPGLSDIDSLISIPKTNPRDSLIQKEKLWESSKLTWLHNAIDSLVEINDYANIVTLLQQDTSRTSLEWIGALYEQSQDWSSLTQLLQNYPNSHSADIEYKDVHSIGMAYQSQEPSGSINQADSLRLMEIATGSSLQGGYAKSLLYLIYGISMEPELNTEENLVTPKEPILRNVAASNSLHPDIRILPNPSNGSIQFLTKSDHSKHIWEITILNTLGQQVFRMENVRSGDWLDPGVLATGVYYIHAKDYDGPGFIISHFRL